MAGPSTITYDPTDPGGVVGVPELRLYADADRAALPVHVAGPGVRDEDGSYSFAVPALPDGTYYLAFDVDYLDGVTATDANDEVTLPLLASGLVSVERYRALTGDDLTPRGRVADALLEALGIVEAFLRRPLTLATRTETLVGATAPGGFGVVVRPQATPVVEVNGGAVTGRTTVRLDGTGLGLGSSAGGEVTITYRGGYTPATLPGTLARVIARTARELVTPSSVPAGAVSVSNGDVSVSFAAGEAGRVLDAGARADLLPFRRRRI